MKKWLASLWLYFAAAITSAGPILHIPAQQLQFQVAPLLYDLPKNISNHRKIAVNDPSHSDNGNETLKLSRKVYLSGASIASASVASDSPGGFAVNLRFTTKGARDFAAFTRENSGRSIAVINKKQQYLLSTPFIHNEIFGGQVQISGVQTAQLAHEIIANKQNITFHLIANADTVDNEEYQEISLRRLPQNHEAVSAWLYYPWKMTSEDMEQLVIEKISASEPGEWADSLSELFYYKARLILNQQGIKKWQHRSEAEFYLLIPNQNGRINVSGIMHDQSQNSIILNIFPTQQDVDEFVKSVRLPQ